MRDSLQSFLNGRVILLAAAAPAEARAVAAAFSDKTPAAVPWLPERIGPQVDLVLTGIGKANAAGCVAHVLSRGTHGAVLSVGVAGALADLPLGTTVAAESCVYADEGLLTPEGFTGCAAMGFPLGDFSGSAVPIDSGLLAVLRPFVDRCGPIATVSTCSGTGPLAREVAARTGALAEGMEGAAVAQVAHRLGVPAGEVRVISNTTGDRPGQRWDLAGALSRLTQVIGRLAL